MSVVFVYVNQRVTQSTLIYLEERGRGREADWDKRGGVPGEKMRRRDDSSDRSQEAMQV